MNGKGTEQHKTLQLTFPAWRGLMGGRVVHLLPGRIARVRGIEPRSLLQRRDGRVLGKSYILGDALEVN